MGHGAGSEPGTSAGTRLLYGLGVAALAAYAVFRFRHAMLTFYVLDDFWVMRDAARISLQSLADVQQFFWFSHPGFLLYRPLTTTAYSYLLQTLFGFDSAGQHAFQLLVFALNVVLVTDIIRRLTGSSLAGLAGGLMYLLAPGQAVNAYWLSAFTVSGTAVWIFLMVWCWLTLGGWARVLACTVLQLCGLLASEHAVTAPALCLLASAVRREAWRPTIAALAAPMLLAGTYAGAKLVYLRGVRPAGPYVVTFSPAAMLEYLGQYVGASFNVVALARPGDSAALAIGIAVLAGLCMAGWAAARGSTGARWVAGGLAIFAVSLLPVLVLRAHFYQHYICVAALGAALAVVGLARLLTSSWRGAALAAAVALLAIDLGTLERAWRADGIFRLVVNGSLGAAAWVRAVQAVSAAQPGAVELRVPANALTNSLFGAGPEEQFLPGMPPRIVRYRADRVPTPAPGVVLLRAARPLSWGDPLPLTDPRWNWLRRFAAWPDAASPLAKPERPLKQPRRAGA